MIRLFIFSLLAILVSLWVTLSVGFPSDPGYLLIAFGEYTFETSLFALLVLILFIYLCVRLLLLILGWVNPMRLVAAGKKISQRRRARSNTLEGLHYFARGNWQSALKLLRKGLKDKDASVVNYLAAAYAAFEMGEKDEWKQLLELAEGAFPVSKSTVNSLRAQLLYRSEQLEQCLAVLEQAKKTSLNDPTLMTLLKDVYFKLEEWSALESLLPTLEKNKVIVSDEAEKIRKRLLMVNLSRHYEKAVNGFDSEQAQLRKQWKKSPQLFQHDAEVVGYYSNLLLDLGDKEEAAKIIEHALEKCWNADLIRHYGAIDYDSHSRQLLLAEGWLKSRPVDAELQLTLARLCMRGRLWGKAREYYEASIKIKPTACALGELGRMLRQLGEIEASEDCLRRYDEMVGGQLLNLPMPEKDRQTG
ncbi:MAG: heme biosynthesis HemY N-terminal domain-containing protein [Pseudomonadota bacterium]|nr:heme biosynthesis HemY N-terminal domain-containing protein [Pseudomonadota bacterium]